MNSKLLGLKIKQLRSEHSLKIGNRFLQKDLANVLGISRGYLGDIESGRTKPNNELINKIANVFNVPLSVLDDSTPVGSYLNYKNFEEDDSQEHGISHEKYLKNNLNISDRDNELIESFHKLNETGKSEAVKRVKELTMITTYTADYLMPVAAHDKEGNFSEEDLKHDSDIMNNDEFWNK